MSGIPQTPDIVVKTTNCDVNASMQPHSGDRPSALPASFRIPDRFRSPPRVIGCASAVKPATKFAPLIAAIPPKVPLQPKGDTARVSGKVATTPPPNPANCDNPAMRLN